jgi:hypothetical protein
MKMMYRKPTVKIMDRHTLIELDGDFTDYEIGHLLNKAYLNHKAPHEYDELKKYIRDLVIGKHNSVYIMNNGNPNPLASASVLGAPYLSTISTGTGLYYDWLGTSSYPPSYCTNATLGVTNSSTNCSSNTAGYISWGPILYGYNNGTAVEWELYYTTVTFPQEGANPSSSNPVLIVGPTGLLNRPYASPKYSYAPYISSNNPLTLSTYYYWDGTGNSGASSLSFNYVYFNIVLNDCYQGACFCPYVQSIIPLFSSSGSFTFQANTYYIGMWQFTYT